MTGRHAAILLLAALVLLLAACAGAGGRLQRAGAAEVFDLRLHTSLDWARIRAARQEAWTIDGLPLNQLRIVSGIRPGEHVFLAGRERKGRPDGPWYRAGMRPDEVRDIVLDALRGNAWAQVQAHELRPVRVAGAAASRFEISLSNRAGLKYRGLVLAVERGGTLTLLLWLAPQEHYFARDAGEVSRMFGSIQFLR